MDERILESAVQLVLERGIDSMTVDEVAVRARVGKATVYRRWSHKLDLAATALDRLYLRIAPMTDTGKLRADVVRLFAGLLEFTATAEGQHFLRISAAEGVRDPRVARVHREARGRFEQRLTTVFEQARLRGEITSTAPTAWACQFVGTFLISPLVTGRATPSQDDAPALADLMLHGLVGTAPVR